MIGDPRLCGDTKRIYKDRYRLGKLRLEVVNISLFFTDKRLAPRIYSILYVSMDKS